MTVSVFAAGLLIGVTASASAAPKPTLSQVQAKLSKLQSQLQKLDQQYDQVKQQLAATDQRLALINKEVAAYGVKFATLRAEIGRIAVTAYEDGNLNSSVALLTSGKPQQILNQSSILLELSASNAAQINQFLTAAKQLTSTQLLAKRTQVGILQLQSGLSKRRQAMQKLVNQEQALVNQLTPAQQAAVGPYSRAHDITGEVHRTHRDPGREGSRVRLRQDRLPVRVRRHRPVRGRLRLLRPDHVRPGPTRASPFRAPARSSGRSCRTSARPTCSRVTSWSSTELATWASTSGTTS